MPKIDTSLTPYWQTTDGSTVHLYQGNCLNVLKQLPDQSVHMVVTSPPYWGLRDYGTDKSLEIGSEKKPDCLGWATGKRCGVCHVCQIGAVFREVRRVLRDDGTLWLNYGDTYGGELKSGNLGGIPWRVALALQADGWILRQDIIWMKPSPMPESVRNRCTKAHEYIFLFVKKMGYFYDAEAIKDKSISNPHKPGWASDVSDRNDRQVSNESNAREWGSGVSNKRSVWTVASQGYAGAHFATFPPKLIEPCIKAGTSEKGCCAKCGAPWVRVVEVNRVETRPGNKTKYGSVEEDIRGGDGMRKRRIRNDTTIGWKPTCKCNADVVPCVVLDPFIGSGTTCCVSISLGRNSIGIDLSKQYLDHNAIPRISGELLTKPATAHLAGRKAKKVSLGRRIA